MKNNKIKNSFFVSVHEDDTNAMNLYLTTVIKEVVAENVYKNNKCPRADSQNQHMHIKLKGDVMK